jgi:spore maturation protein B
VALSQTISQVVSNGLILSFIAGIPLLAYLRKINIFESFIEGAQDGFQLAIRITPYLVAFLVAIGMFRAAGGFALLTQLLGPAMTWLGVPTDLLPMAVVRPFSGSASLAMLNDVAKSHGGDSFVAHAGAILMGSTETTFYVAMVYFGAAQVYRARHAIACGLLADLVGVIAACWCCRFFL